MKKWYFCLLVLLVFFVPIEHKYDKLFRHVSLELIPEGLSVSKQYDKKIYFYITDLLAILLLFAIPLRKTIRSPLFIVLLCAAISIAFSPFSHYLTPYTRLLTLLGPIALFFYVSHSSPKLSPILLAIVLAGILQTTISILQYFHQAPLGLRLLNEYNPYGYINFPDGHRWFFDSLSNRVANISVMRAYGTLPHPNILGGFLCVSILATYYLVLKRTWVLSLTLPFQFFALCITYSRSALFALAIGTISFLWQFRNKILITSIALSVAVSAFLLHEQFVYRGGIVNYNAVAQGSDKQRVEYQKTAIDVIKQNPVFGVGFDQFSERTNCPSAPHNIFLFLGCETGLIALSAFIFWVISLLFGAFKNPFNLEVTTLFSMFIAFLFIGLCDFYPILTHTGKMFLFLIAGLLAAFCHKQYETQSQKKEIWKLFDVISPTYDKINRVLSLGMDQFWRAKVGKCLPKEGALKILDLATGTGDQAIALLKQNRAIASITGIDLSQEMLEIAKKKNIPKTHFLKADAEQLPFENQSFDAATFSFGIRNVTSPLQSLKEIHRVLISGGQCFILEFSHPKSVIKPFYFFYLRHVLPFIGGLLSGKYKAYRYLNQTIEQFPSGPAFQNIMKTAGFINLRQKRMALGAVSIYIGEKK